MVFWSLVLTGFTIYWSVRCGRWAWATDRERKKTHAQMRSEMSLFIVQIETGKGPADPGAGLSASK